MERWSRFLPVVIAILVAGCNDPAMSPDPYEGLSEQDIRILGTWRYESVQVEERIFELATSEMEPGFVKADLGGARAELNRRMVAYYPEKTYQLLWIDRGNYSLGVPGLPNWQPEFGSWRFNAAGDTLIHNPGTHYETRYHIVLGSGGMLRTSSRYMNSSLQDNTRTVWTKGQWVDYTEQFRKMQEQ